MEGAVVSGGGNRRRGEDAAASKGAEMNVEVLCSCGLDVAATKLRAEVLLRERSCKQT
jgi:hypothetical protein